MPLQKAFQGLFYMICFEKLCFEKMVTAVQYTHATAKKEKTKAVVFKFQVCKGKCRIKTPSRWLQFISRKKCGTSSSHLWYYSTLTSSKRVLFYQFTYLDQQNPNPMFIFVGRNRKTSIIRINRIIESYRVRPTEMDTGFVFYR